MREINVMNMMKCVYTQIVSNIQELGVFVFERKRDIYDVPLGKTL